MVKRRPPLPSEPTLLDANNVSLMEPFGELPSVIESQARMQFLGGVRFATPPASSDVQKGILQPKRFSTPQSISNMKQGFVFSPTTPFHPKSLESMFESAVDENAVDPNKAKEKKPTKQGTRNRGKQVKSKMKQPEPVPAQVPIVKPKPRIPDPNREPIKVYLRVRPFVSNLLESDEPCVSILGSSAVELHAPLNSMAARTGADTEGRFVFTRVFDQSTTQKSLFVETALPLVKSLLQGQNSLIFAYGVSSSGKTYTINGKEEAGQSGVLPRIIEVTFNSLKGALGEADGTDQYLTVVKEQIRKTHEAAAEVKVRQSTGMITEEPDESEKLLLIQDQALSEEQIALVQTTDVDGTTVPILDQFEYGVSVSYLEIYNEQIYDLLVDTPQNGKREILKLKQTRTGEVVAKGLTEVRVNSQEEAMLVMRMGSVNRRVAETILNRDSSRSHSVFYINVQMTAKDKNGNISESASLSARLCIVDLAGSERMERTGHTGDRVKEAGNINTSLMNLGLCLDTLRWNQRRVNTGKKRVVPFRNSKLTRLFQDHFVGQGKAAMIVNISPLPIEYDETLHVLKFSAIAQEVTTAVSKIDNRRNKNAPGTVKKGDVAAIFPDLDLDVLDSNQTDIVANQFDTPSMLQNERKSIQGLEQLDPKVQKFVNLAIEENENLLDQLEEYKFRILEAEARCYEIEDEVRHEVSEEMRTRLNEMEQFYEAQKKQEEEEEQASRSKVSLADKIRAMKPAKERARRKKNQEPGIEKEEETYRKVAMENLMAEQERILQENQALVNEVIKLEASLTFEKQIIEKRENDILKLKSDLASKTTASSDLARQLDSLERAYQEMAGFEQTLRNEMLKEQENIIKDIRERMRRELEHERKRLNIEVKSEKNALTAQVEKLKVERKKLEEKLATSEKRLQEATQLAAFNNDDKNGGVKIQAAGKSKKSPILHAQSRGLPGTQASSHKVVLPENSKVVFSPKKEDLMKNKKPRFTRYEVVNVQDEDTNKGVTTLYKGNVNQSITGQGVSVVLTDVEIVKRQKIEHLKKMRDTRKNNKAVLVQQGGQSRSKRGTKRKSNELEKSIEAALAAHEKSSPKAHGLSFKSAAMQVPGVHVRSRLSSAAAAAVAVSPGKRVELDEHTEFQVPFTEPTTAEPMNSLREKGLAYNEMEMSMNSRLPPPLIPASDFVNEDEYDSVALDDVRVSVASDMVESHGKKRKSSHIEQEEKPIPQRHRRQAAMNANKVIGNQVADLMNKHEEDMKLFETTRSKNGSTRSKATTKSKKSTRKAAGKSTRRTVKDVFEFVDDVMENDEIDIGPRHVRKQAKKKETLGKAFMKALMSPFTQVRKPSITEEPPAKRRKSSEKKSNRKRSASPITPRVPSTNDEHVISPEFAPVVSPPPGMAQALKAAVAKRRNQMIEKGHLSPDVPESASTPNKQEKADANTSLVLSRPPPPRTRRPRQRRKARK